jgi:hypothetical protein
MTRHLYRLAYRRADNLARVYRMTVIAKDADEAREYARLRDPKFGSTIASPRKGREALELGTAIFDAPDRWTCNESGHVPGCAGNAGGDHE